MLDLGWPTVSEGDYFRIGLGYVILDLGMHGQWTGPHSALGFDRTDNPRFHTNPTAVRIWINEPQCKVIDCATDFPTGFSIDPEPFVDPWSSIDSNYPGYNFDSELPFVVVMHPGPGNRNPPHFEYAGKDYSRIGESRNLVLSECII